MVKKLIHSLFGYNGTKYIKRFLPLEISFLAGRAELDGTEFLIGLISTLLIGVLLLILSFFLFINVNFGGDYFVALLPARYSLEGRFNECLHLRERGEQATCLRGFLPEVLKKNGVEMVMGAFDNHVYNYGASLACHDAGHVLGDLVYAYTKDVQKSLTLCSGVCHNGCQHGVIGATVREKIVSGRGYEDLLDGPSNLAALCARLNKSMSPGEYNLCIHGLGHAFLVARDGSITLALNDCDRLGFEVVVGPARQCWSGVFMENTRSILTKSHVQSAKFQNPDPFYPCSVVGLDEKYLISCYYQLHFLPHQDAFEICRKAPPKWIEICAEAVGHSAASRYTDSIDTVVAHCNRGNELAVSCFRGAYNYLWLGAQNDLKNDRRVKEFCTQVGVEKEPRCKVFF